MGVPDNGTGSSYTPLRKLAIYCCEKLSRASKRRIGSLLSPMGKYRGRQTRVLAELEATRIFRESISVKCLSLLRKTSCASLRPGPPFRKHRKALENCASAHRENCSALRITPLKNCRRSEPRFCPAISPSFPRVEKLVFTLTSNLRVPYCSPATAMLCSLGGKLRERTKIGRRPP